VAQIHGVSPYRGLNGNSRCLEERGRVSSSPMTSTATPVSATAEQEHYHNDNQEQFHGISPLMAALFAAYLGIQRLLQCMVPDNRATRQPALWGVSNFAQSSPKFKRAYVALSLNSRPTTLSTRPCSRFAVDRVGRERMGKRRGARPNGASVAFFV
jgi:hypothetical protein